MIGLGLALLLGAPAPSADVPRALPRFTEVRVYVRVISVRANDGLCMDWDFIFCTSKPDFFLTVSGGSPVQQSPMFVAPVVQNLMYVDPAPATWSGGPFVIPRPAKVTIDLFDADGPATDRAGDGSIEDDLTSGRQPVDIRMGPGGNVTLDLEPLIGVGERTFVLAGENAVVRIAVLTELVPGRLISLNLSAPSFRPSDGTTLTMTGTGTGGALLTFTVFGPGGIAFTRTSALPPGPTGLNASVSAVWNGRLPGGMLAPPAQYTVILTGADPMPSPGSRRLTMPEEISKTVLVLAPQPTPTFQLIALDPGAQWAPESGPLIARVASNRDVAVTSRIFLGSACGAGGILASGGTTTLSPGNEGTVSWAGQVPAGTTAVPGAYALELRGTTVVGGTPVGPICAPFSIVALGPPRIVVQHAPFIASPGQTVTFTARVVDDAGLPRRVPALTVSAEAVILGAAAPAGPPAPLATCTNTTTCIVTLTLPAIDSRLAWRADVIDGGGVNVATSGWRGQRVTTWSGVSGTLGTFAIALDEALPGSLSQLPSVAHARGFDLVFNVSDEFQWSNPADIALIGGSLDAFMMRLWGLEGFDTPAGTTFLSRPDLVRVYLNPRQTQVTWAGAANECDWSVPEAAWADARGVLHRASCRDNAYFHTRSFSAKLGARDVIVHELHHALFGLADEYANTPTAAGLGGDGGYSVSAELPNVFNNLADCAAVADRPPGGCTTINEVLRGSVPSVFSGRTFFRLDDPTLPDIMDANGRQRFADIRQARYREARCAQGEC